ncbi:MAG TPA: rhomboid family intramembrane serine protease [Ilumatobacter sp.]|nr:rhomboid family intramembrane serine protease [Ilumatobacter sp.]
MARATEPAASGEPTGSQLTASLVPVGLMLAAMWVLEIIDTVVGHRLDQHGIRPRRLDGVDGIAWAPFLHGGFGHLIANTLPFAVLGGAIALGALKRFVLVTVIVAVIGGVGTWLTGAANSVHIGASGLVFGFLTYLLTRGLFARNLVYILGGIVVFMVYGGVLWGILPSPGISWQGHLFGAIGGVVAAYALHADREAADSASSGQPGKPGTSSKRKSLIDRLSPPGYEGS